jgi:hypothetical protein
MTPRDRLDLVHLHLAEAGNALAKAMGSISPDDMPKVVQLVTAIGTAQSLLSELSRRATPEPARGEPRI